MSVSINEAIRTLRSQIAEAVNYAAQHSDQGVLMTIEEAEIELEVSIATQDTVNGEVNVWVVKVGGQSAETTTDSHRLRLTLKARSADGSPIKVGSHSRIPEPPTRAEH